MVKVVAVVTSPLINPSSILPQDKPLYATVFRFRIIRAGRGCWPSGMPRPCLSQPPVGLPHPADASSYRRPTNFIPPIERPTAGCVKAYSKLRLSLAAMVPISMRRSPIGVSLSSQSFTSPSKLNAWVHEFVRRRIKIVLSAVSFKFQLRTETQSRAERAGNPYHKTLTERILE